jgi:ribosomal protein S27AE
MAFTKEIKMSCIYKHTSVQIPDEEWICPKCGVGVEYTDKYGDKQEGFVVVDSVNYDCELLHDDDELECGRCGYSASGLSYSRWYKKSKDLVKCPCCKGTGVITKKKAEEYRNR